MQIRVMTNIKPKVKVFDIRVEGPLLLIKVFEKFQQVYYLLDLYKNFNLDFNKS